MPAAWRYRDWITDLITPYLGARPLLLAAGEGDYAQAWIDRGVPLVVSEEDPRQVQALRARFAGVPGVDVRRVCIPPEGETDRYTAVIALNVLEHVDDDEGALRGLRDLLEPHGALIVMVPACPMAMSAFDRRIGHLRRYWLRELVALAGHAGLCVQEVRYFNSLGLLAWIIGVRMLRLTPEPGLMLTAWDTLGISTLRMLEQHWAPPFGKALFMVATPAEPLQR
jgi:SAM-dependent methyltransferase